MSGPGVSQDRAATVRSGEELDAEALGTFLRRELPELAGPLEVRQFPRGFSNLTYLVQVGETEMILRRPPFGSKVATAHDMGREHRILSRLHPVWPKVPRPLAYCEDPSVLGAPFYLMERVRGVILRAESGGKLGLSPEAARRLSEALVDTLAELHGVDVKAAGLGGLGKPEGYVERQVAGWARRYQGSQTDDVPEMEAIGRWLLESLPPEQGAALIHNDFKYDNLVLDPDDLTTVRAALDWEMATLGDPLMDLGTTLGYWVEAGDPEPLQQFRFGPTHLPGSLDRQGLARRYSERTGRDLPDLAFYYVFGLFKIAVIVQQIYYRYVHGHTRDERFAALLQVVRILGRAASRVVETGRI